MLLRNDNLGLNKLFCKNSVCTFVVFLCHFVLLQFTNAVETKYRVLSFTFINFKYTIVTNPLTFLQADRSCYEEYSGAELAKIYSKDVQDQIISQMNKSKISGKFYYTFFIRTIKF